MCYASGMAKRSTALASRPSIIVVSPPARRGGIRRAARRAGGVARRAGRRVAHHSKAHVPAVSMALGGAIVGYLKSKGFLDKLPKLGGSNMVTLGVVGYAATRFIKNPTARAAGLAALTVAAFDFGQQQGGAPSGLDTEGDGAEGFVESVDQGHGTY